VESWLYAQAKVHAYQKSLSEENGGGFMMMSMGTDSNILITAMAQTTHGLELVIGYPDTFTNRLEVYRSTDLVERDWEHVAGPLETTGTTHTAWTDTASPGPWRFYAAGNYDLDSDSDGFNDAFELFVLGTDPNDADSYGVYLSGDVFYDGPESGTIYVQAVTDSVGNWSKTWQSSHSTPGPYTNIVANQQSYWVKSYMDISGNQQHDAWEPWGFYSTNALYATNDVSGLNITLQDQPSIWGTLDYSGGATGDIHVIAVGEPNWDMTYYTHIPWVQAYGSVTGDPVFVSFPVNYTITGMPPGDYFIRAFMDENGDGHYTSLETDGQYASEPISVSNRVTGIDFELGVDTDGNGIPDWWELQHFGGATNAVWDADPDGDEGNNWEEYYFGTDPLNSDTDGDWFLDGYEIETATDPLDSFDLPGFIMVINGGASHTSSTNLLITFPGLIADTTEIGETADLNDSTIIGFGDNLPYSLQNDSNGARRVYARLWQGAESSPLIQREIILDTMPPEILGTSPTNGHVTIHRWIKLTGDVTDTVSRVRVFVNDEWAHGMAVDSFSHDRIMLQAGTNEFVIRAEDLAGNVTNKTVQIIQDTTGDTTAPALELFLPGQSVDTNGHCFALYGDSAKLYFSGWTDDETAQILVYSIADTVTNGPWEAVITGTQVWANVQLAPGTNEIVALAQDATGNTSTASCHAIRNMDVVFRITYPEPYQVMNAPSTVVHGIASPMFLNATITVNNVATTMEDHGSNITFTTLSGVPLDEGRTEIIGKAEGEGFVYFADPTVLDYEVTGYQQRIPFSDYRNYYSLTDCYYFAELTEEVAIASWDATTGLYRWEKQGEIDFWSRNPPHCVETHSSEPIYVVSQHYTSASSIFFWMGHSTWTYSSPGATSESHYETETSLRFIKRWPTQELQTVVLQFPDMIYLPDQWATDWWWDNDPSLITYRGQTGFWYNGNISFIVPIETEVEYTITEADFEWPGYSAIVFGDTYDHGKLLGLSANVSNDVLKVELEDSSTDNFSPQLGETATLNVKLDPPPPEGGFPGIYFELEIVRKLDGGGTQHIQWIDVDPIDPGIDLARDADFTSLALEWNGIPHPQVDGNASQAVGLDEFIGVSGNFKRILPAVTAGQPVPPPLYYAVARLRKVADHSILLEDERAIYVPQVVTVSYDSNAIDELKEPFLSGTTVVVSAFSDLQVDQMKAALEEAVVSYYGNHVNIRFGDLSPSGPYSTLLVHKGTGADPYGSAPLDFGNSNPSQEARIYVYRRKLDAAIEYEFNPSTFTIPVTSVEITTSMGITSTHEIGHILGLVAENAVLDGSSGSHNKPPHTPRQIMNPGGGDLENHLGRNGAWSFKALNHNYLKFVLPTP